MRRFFLICIVFCSVNVFAQQDAQFTQYMDNKIFINPAFAGANGAICLSSIFRHQWTGFGDGNPQTLNINVDMPIYTIGGIGLSITSDQLGFENNLGVGLSYAHRIPMGAGDFALGISLGMLQKGLSDMQWIAPDGSNGAGDSSIPQTDESKIVPDFGFGLVYLSDAFFVGLSSKHLAPLETVTGSKLKNHVYLYGGSRIDISPAVQLHPSVLLKSDLASMQFDLNLNAVLQSKFRAGISYRMHDAVAVLLGYNITEQLSFGYAYDITTSEMRQFSSGTHEVMLRYCFNVSLPEPTPQRFRNVRFL